MTVERLHPKKPIRSRILFWVIVLSLLLLAPSIWLLGEEAGTPHLGRSCPCGSTASLSTT
jgi:hypothetical protein